MRATGRRTLIALGLVLAPSAAVAQPAAKIPRVGIVGVADGPPWEAFRQELKQLGHVDGKTVVLEWRFYGGKVELLPQLLVELVRARVDVLVVAAGAAPYAAKEATSSIPIVSCALSADPVATGLVTSLARPGGNLTGVTTTTGETEAGKRLQLVKELLPRASRIAYVYQSNVSGAEIGLKGTQAGARALGVQLQLHATRGPQDFDGLFPAIARQRPDALVTGGGSPFIFARQQQIADFGLQERLVTLCPSREGAEAGCPMSYAANLVSLFRRCGHYVHRILTGAKPGDLPIEQPTVFELVINGKTARALGVTIPPSLRVLADQLIE